MLQAFIGAFFNAMSAAGIQYCVLRNYEGLPNSNLGSDIDLLVHPDNLPVCLSLLSASGVRITDCVTRYYVTSVFVDGISDFGTNGALQVDFFTHLVWKGVPYLSVDEVLSSAETVNGLIVRPSEHHEAIISLFTNFVLGGWIKERYQDKIVCAFRRRGSEVRAALRPHFSESIIDALVVAVAEDNRSRMFELLPKIRRNMLFRAVRASPLLSLSRILAYVKSEVVIRYTSAPLREVCILGMDGAGKSTVISSLRGELVNRTKDVEVIHLKPKFRATRSPVKVVNDPHALAPRTRPASLLKLTIWVAAYWLRRVVHRRKNATLVIWDRYIYDVLADPLRYRVDLPSWVLGLLCAAVPKPMLVVVLDVAPETAFSRKPEVPIESLTQIRARYLKLQLPCPKIVVATDCDIGQSVSEVTHAVCSALAARAAK